QRAPGLHPRARGPRRGQRGLQPLRLRLRTRGTLPADRRALPRRRALLRRPRRRAAHAPPAQRLLPLRGERRLGRPLRGGGVPAPGPPRRDAGGALPNAPVRNVSYQTPELARYFSGHRDKWGDFYPSERWIVSRVAREAGGLGRVLDAGCASGGLGRALA